MQTAHRILGIAPIVAHPRWSATQPTDLGWWAIAILTALVFGAHAMMDFLAGAGGTFGMSICELENASSACAVVIWVAFMLAGRVIGRGERTT
jgi:hypothetical protein